MRVYPHAYGFQNIPLSKIDLKLQLHLEQSQSVKIQAGNKNSKFTAGFKPGPSLHATVCPSVFKVVAMYINQRENSALELCATLTPKPWASQHLWTEICHNCATGRHSGDICMKSVLKKTGFLTKLRRFIGINPALL